MMLAIEAMIIRCVETLLTTSSVAVPSVGRNGDQFRADSHKTNTDTEYD